MRTKYASSSRSRTVRDRLNRKRARILFHQLQLAHSLELTNWAVLQAGNWKKNVPSATRKKSYRFSARSEKCEVDETRKWRRRTLETPRRKRVHWKCAARVQRPVGLSRADQADPMAEFISPYSRRTRRTSSDDPWHSQMDPEYLRNFHGLVLGEAITGEARRSPTVSTPT